MEINELQKYLDALKNIPVRPKRERSLMDITGIKRHENLWSDIYKFFFAINEEHLMSDLFIRSLESVIGVKSNFLETFSIRREFVVAEKRIDLLLCDNINNRAIIIENKVNHILDNDLNLYYNKVKENGYSNVIVLVLGIKKYDLNIYEKANQIPKDKLFSITHKMLIDKVSCNIANINKLLNPQYLYLYQEFAKNIINITNDMSTDELSFYFSEDNRLKINELSDIRSRVINHISDSLQNKEILNHLFDKYKLDLEVGKCKNNEYIYYPFKGYEGLIMITLVYHSLWDFKSHGCRIQALLEIQGDKMIKWVMNNYHNEKSMAGLNKNQKYWHYYSCDIPFNPKEIEEDFQENLCKKLSDDNLCPIFRMGKNIIEHYEQQKDKH